MIKQLAHKFTIVTLIASLMLAVVPSASAQSAEGGQLMFIFDASSSMLATDGSGSTRLDRAKQALSQSLDTLPAEASVGLRAYGHTVPESDQANGCRDTALLNAPAPNNRANIKTSINNIQAKGWTPIGESLRAVAGDFKTDGVRSVILISDGVDTCAPPDPCDIAKELAAQGIKLKVNTLGLVVDNAARAQLQCISAATGGNYYDVSDIDRLRTIVGAVASREANLFSANGVPIKGNPRYEEAPLLLEDTAYTDSIIDTEELYYGFDLLPEQEFNFTVRTEPVGRGVFGAGVGLSMEWFDADTGQRLSTAGGESSRIAIIDSVGSSTLFIKNKAKHTDGSKRYAMQLTLRARGNTTPLPYEIKLTKTGGTLPTNETPASDTELQNGETASANGFLSNPLVTLLIGLAVPAIAFGIYMYVKKRRSTKAAEPADPSSPNDPIDPAS